MGSWSYQWLLCQRDLSVSHVIRFVRGAGHFWHGVVEARSTKGISVRLATPSKQIANKRQFDSQDGSSSGWQRLCWRLWQPGDGDSFHFAVWHLWQLVASYLYVGWYLFHISRLGYWSFLSLWSFGGFTAIYTQLPQVIWHSTVWVIWKERNNKIFKNKAHDSIKLLDYVKFMSFSWLKVKLLSTTFSYNDWWRNPLLCMGIRE